MNKDLYVSKLETFVSEFYTSSAILHKNYEHISGTDFLVGPLSASGAIEHLDKIIDFTDSGTWLKADYPVNIAKVNDSYYVLYP